MNFHRLYRIYGKRLGDGAQQDKVEFKIRARFVIITGLSRQVESRFRHMAL